jgi:serine/threonine protein kinase
MSDFDAPKRNESQGNLANPLDDEEISTERYQPLSVPITPVVPRMDANLLGRGHFMFGRTLGEGSYARVVHAKMKIENSPDFAIKIMEKSFIQKEKKVKYVLMEKEILSIVNHPFIIK